MPYTPHGSFKICLRIRRKSCDPSGDLEQIESKIIRQGLDLRGGMYIVLEADIPTLVGNLRRSQGRKTCLGNKKS